MTEAPLRPTHAALPRTTEPVAARKRRVLLIHESPATRDALEISLQGSFDVRVAKDAEDGWHAVLIDQSIRAIVASLSSLELNSYGMLQRVRRSKVSRISSMPVLIVEETEDPAVRILARSLGATEVASMTRLGELRARVQGLVEPKPATVAGAPGALQPPPPPAHPEVPAVPIPPKPTTPPATETSMSRLESLNKVLKTLQSSSPGVEASALISTDGLMIASALAKDMDETRIAAMTATLLSLGTRAATELRRGEVSEVIVRGEQGYAVMLSAGRGSLLLVLATEATPLGLIFFDMREAVKGIKAVL